MSWLLRRAIAAYNRRGRKGWESRFTPGKIFLRPRGRNDVFAGRRDGAGLIEGSKGGTKWSIIISSKKTRVVPLPVYPRLWCLPICANRICRERSRPRLGGGKAFPQREREREREREGDTERVSRFIYFTAPSSRNSSLALQNPRSIAVQRYCAKNR